MEYAAGGSLLDRIHQTYIMDEDECKFVFYQIGCALAYLHRLKIVREDQLKWKTRFVILDLGSSRYKTS
jgi:serine/threonine protein kinase